MGTSMVIRRHGVRYRWVTLGGFHQVSCVTTNPKVVLPVKPAGRLDDQTEPESYRTGRSAHHLGIAYLGLRHEELRALAGQPGQPEARPVRKEDQRPDFLSQYQTTTRHVGGERTLRHHRPEAV